jgi:hypothetical protein
MRLRPGGRRASAGRVGVATGTAALALLAGCGSSHHSAAKTTTTTVPPTSTTSTSAPKHLAVCPLTGAPPRSGKVPHRAAVAVKVENLDQARPQWGLDQADIVFEEPVEGGITRFVAVFQCQDASRIEPVRSGRLVDAQILEPLGKVLFAYAGAIQPVVQKVDSPGSLLEDVGVETSGQAYWRDPDRLAPHNLATSTALLYQAAAAKGYPETPPNPIFSYGPLPRGAKPVTAVHIGYPLDVTTWTWSPGERKWLRSYACPPGLSAECIPTDNGPAVLGNDEQISATNVVVMHVHMYPTAYVEDDTGAHENELVLTGSGPAWVFRDGEELAGTWERPDLAAPATFTEADGARITLSPGRTWEELVPEGDGVAVSGASQH